MRQTAEGNLNREPEPGHLSLSLSVCDVRPNPHAVVVAVVARCG